MLPFRPPQRSNHRFFFKKICFIFNYMYMYVCGMCTRMQVPEEVRGGGESPGVG